MRHRRIKFRGLAFQSWLYIVMFSVLILLTLYSLQVIFLNAFYEGMKTREIVRIGEYLTKAYGDEQFDTMVQEYAFKNGMMVMLVDENGAGVSGFGFMRDRVPWRDFGVDFEKLKQSFDTNNTGSVHFTVGESDRRLVVYVSSLADAEGNPEYLVIVSFLPPLDSTAIVLRSQFKIIIFIILLVSLIVALLFSRKLSVPILAITKSAKRLAQGDLSVEFAGEGYDEIKELADTLNYATAELSKTDRYQKEFIANVSHDLRTPLTLIKFYGEMIRDISGDDRVKRTEACDTIIKEADWLTGMVNELLELSKLQLGDMEPDMSEFSISDCLRGITDTVRVMVEHDGYTLALDIADGLAVTGSEQGIKRAMYNLIGNALDYTGEDKHISIRLKAVEHGVRFEVSDTGAGVPEDEMKKVWDRYYKSGATHRRGVIGTGIGLSIAKNVLDAHNAAYGVENLPEGGAMFWFELG